MDSNVFGNIIRKCVGGNVKDANLDGHVCKVYIPDNVSSSTPIHVYFPGEDGNSKWDLVNILQERGSNSLIVIEGTKDNFEAAMDATEYLGSTLKMGDLGNVSISGVSAGGASAVRAAVSAVQNHPDMSIKSITRLATWYQYSTDSELTDERLKILADAKIPMLNGTFDPEAYEGGHTVPSRYAEMGGKVFGIGLTGGHDQQCKSLYKIGYIDLLNGEADENTFVQEYIDPKEIYYSYDAYGNVWYITKDQFLDAFNLWFTYDGTSIETKRAFHYISGFSGVVCNNTVIKNSLNNIVNAVKGSSFVNNAFSFSPSSTTQIPSGEADLINQIVGKISIVFSKLLHDTEEIAYMSDTYDNLDKTFAALADDVNSNINGKSLAYVNHNASRKRTASEMSSSNDKDLGDIEVITFD